ncbi:hypothetical protein [Streptomyces sp. SA3_actF]|uniref:hypothetical protein n=1 Tax=Streptomyces sp. SA3_actF TaxID=682181 RepID=UPI0002000E26|nr:hypothetical protein [Streptomyces sp. SA3_actF]
MGTEQGADAERGGHGPSGLGEVGRGDPDGTCPLLDGLELVLGGVLREEFEEVAQMRDRGGGCV